MPHQLDLEKETVTDVYRKLARWCSEKTAPLGNAALAVLTGDSELWELGIEMDKMALAENHDLIALKAKAREYCQLVERKLSEGFGGEKN